MKQTSGPSTYTGPSQSPRMESSNVFTRTLQEDIFAKYSDISTVNSLY